MGQAVQEIDERLRRGELDVFVPDPTGQLGPQLTAALGADPPERGADRAQATRSIRRCQADPAGSRGCVDAGLLLTALDTLQRLSQLWLVPVTADRPGEYELSGIVKLSVCSATACHIHRQRLVARVTVQ